MHLTRAEISRVTPIPRKGTQYVARPRGHTRASVSVLGAVRDMLHLAHTAREVNEMIKEKKLKINGRVVRDQREPLLLLSHFEADKRYLVTLLPTGRFSLEPTKDAHRVGKVVNKKILKNGVVQINLHDGTNFLTKEKIKVGDSVSVDAHNKPLKVIPMKEGSHVLVSSGRNVGRTGVVAHIKGSMISVTIGETHVSLKPAQVVAL